MRPKLGLMIYRICIAAGIVLMIVSALTDLFPQRGLGILIGCAVGVVGAVVANVYYKCPHCGVSINPRGKQKDYCPECGKKLDF